MAASTWERFVNTDPLSLPSTFSIDECLDFPMSSLEYNFILLKYCGIWCPLEWSSGWKTRFYSCYTAIVVAVVFTISSADMIKTLLSIGYVEEFAEGMLLLLTLISCCGKILTLLVHRQRIILLFETFKCPVCQATNSQEAAVRKTSHQSMRTRTDGFICVMVSTMMLMTIRCITTNIPRRTLPLRIWLPFDVDTEKVYWLVFFVEFFSLFFAGIIDIAYATLVPTFMSSICEQFGLLECRIQLFILSIENSQYPEKHRIQFEKKQFVDSVQHHLLLFQFANEANDIFGPALLMQYISSITVICMCIYQLGQLTSFNLHLISTSFYTCRIFFEIFLMCLAGTELTEASQTFCSTMYNTRWDKLHPSNKKNVILMMTRSSKPIIFSTAKLIQMSLDSYLKIIKLSYTLYNFLQQSSKK